MKIIAKHEALERKNSDICVVTEYPKIDGMIDFAIANIDGIYPPEKRAVNKQCKEIVYIAEGNGQITVEDQNYTLNKGDVILIEPGEKFVWQGKMTLHISCRPAFTIEQHVIVD